MATKPLEEMILEIVENPPMKWGPCSRCHGHGRINHTGLISSDPCPECEGVWVNGENGVEQMRDDDAFLLAIRSVLDEHLAGMEVPEVFTRELTVLKQTNEDGDFVVTNSNGWALGGTRAECIWVAQALNFARNAMIGGSDD